MTNGRSYDYTTKNLIDIMQADLDTAKKALKAYAFFDWVSAQMPMEEWHLARPIFVNINDSLEFTKMRDKYPFYFRGETYNLDREYMRFVQDFEGTVGDNGWIPGLIAKELDGRMIDKARSRNFWWNEYSKIDYPCEFSGPCHAEYCQAIPIHELSQKTRIDLAGRVIPAITWAFQ